MDRTERLLGSSAGEMAEPPYVHSVHLLLMARHDLQALPDTGCTKHVSRIWRRSHHGDRVVLAFAQI